MFKNFAKFDFKSIEQCKQEIVYHLNDINKEYKAFSSIWNSWSRLRENFKSNGFSTMLCSSNFGLGVIQEVDEDQYDERYNQICNQATRVIKNDYNSLSYGLCASKSSSSSSLGLSAFTYADVLIGRQL